MTISPRPRPLSARFGVLGAIGKRIVERLIRFYTVQQDEVNRNLEARVADLEAAPVERRGDERDLRAQYAALSARLTYVQREIAVLRSRIDDLHSGAEDAAAEGPDSGAAAP